MANYTCIFLVYQKSKRYLSKDILTSEYKLTLFCSMSVSIIFENNSQCIKVKSLSHVQLFATPWAVAYQIPPSMRFSRQEYWSGLHFLLQRIFPTQRSNPGLPHCKRTLYCLSHQGSKKYIYNECLSVVKHEF